MARKGYRQTPEHRARIADALRQPPPKFKVCPHCRRRRRASSYRLRVDGRTLHSYCRECEKKLNRAKSKKYWDAHPEHRERREEANRATTLRRHYGMTGADYDAMLTQQGGGCAICGCATPGSGRKYLAVDHCHTSGAVRGLLCQPCNLGLGAFKDDPRRLANAVTYITKQPPIERTT